MLARSRGAAWTRRRATVRLLVIVWLLCAAIAPRAHADKLRIAVTPFSGEEAGRIEADVVEMIEGQVGVISSKVVARAQAELGSADVSEETMAAMARKLMAHGVLSGAISRGRKQYRLVLTLRVGETGAVVEEFAVVLGRKPRLGSHARRRIESILEPAIFALPSNAPGLAPPQAEPAEEEAKEARTGPGLTSDPGAADETSVQSRARTAEQAVAKATRRPASSMVAARTRGPAHDVTARAERRGALPSRPGIDLTAGASMLGRRLTFTTRPAFEDPPFVYHGNPVPAGRVQAELYPFALFGARGFFSGLGGTFVFERVISMSSRVEGLGAELPTRHQRWQAGVHYRIHMGEAKNSFAITLGGGYGEHLFTLDRTAIMDTTLAIDIPDVTYRAFDPGLAMRIPLSSSLALHARGAYLAIRDAGAIETREAYGDAFAWGIDSELGATLDLSSWLACRLGGQYTLVTFDFLDQGVLRDRDGDGVNDIERALDQFFGASLTCGLQF